MQTVNPVLRRYAAGEISVLKAAALLGDKVTVGDVFVMLLQAGLQPPRPSPDRERAELEHARHVLGLD
jgi:hypothetical protein